VSEGGFSISEGDAGVEGVKFEESMGTEGVMGREAVMVKESREVSGEEVKYWSKSIL